MTALDPQIIAKRLAHLEEVTVKLEQERPLTADDISTHDVLSDATLYRIQTGIETIVDIGSHLLTELYRKHPDTYKDTLKEMGNAGILSAGLVEENLAMVDFRNIIVHHYVELDPAKTLINVKRAPHVFRQFAKQMTSFMQTVEQ